jgi:hypothetical protein
VVEDGEPIPAEEDLEDSFITSTLGEIYLRQGLLGRAEWVFESLLEEDPGNEQLGRRLEEVQDLLRTRATTEAGAAQTAPVSESAGGEASAPVANGPETSVAEWLPEDFPNEVSYESGKGEIAEDFVDGVPEIVPIESLAPDRTMPAEPLLPVVEDSAGLSGAEVVPVESLGPDGPVPVESLVPEVPAPVESLAPDGPIPIADLAPSGPVPIESLAPDGPIPVADLAPSGPVPIESLAPDGPIPIVDLAPSGPVPIESLAPTEPEPIGFLAPDNGSRDGASAPGEAPDSTIQDFERWLDRLL